MKKKPHLPKRKRTAFDSDESIHALQGPSKELAVKKTTIVGKPVPFDEWVKLFRLDPTRKPLFEVVFPRLMLEKESVYRFLYENKVYVQDYGPDNSGTAVCYFEEKWEAKEFRDALRLHWEPARVSAGPLHRKYADIQ